MVEFFICVNLYCDIAEIIPRFDGLKVSKLFSGLKLLILNIGAMYMLEQMEQHSTML